MWSSNHQDVSKPLGESPTCRCPRGVSRHGFSPRARPDLSLPSLSRRTLPRRTLSSPVHTDLSLPSRAEPSHAPRRAHARHASVAAVGIQLSAQYSVRGCVHASSQVSVARRLGLRVSCSHAAFTPSSMRVLLPSTLTQAIASPTARLAIFAHPLLVALHLRHFPGALAPPEAP